MKERENAVSAPWNAMSLVNVATIAPDKSPSEKHALISMEIMLWKDAKDHIIRQIDDLKARGRIQQNSAIVYDIDGTLIDERIINGKRKPIESIVDTYYYAISKGLKVFLVTARPGDRENVFGTIDELENIGIPPETYEGRGIYFMNRMFPEYKEQCRKNIRDAGYNILMSIGDNEWDVGKHGGIGILLFPN